MVLTTVVGSAAASHNSPPPPPPPHTHTPRRHPHPLLSGALEENGLYLSVFEVIAESTVAETYSSQTVGVITDPSRVYYGPFEFLDRRKNKQGSYRGGEKTVSTKRLETAKLVEVVPLVQSNVLAVLIIMTEGRNVAFYVS